MRQRKTVFISDSHRDEAWKRRLVSQLRVLEQQGLLDVWDDRRIGAGDAWHAEIDAAMRQAQVAVFNDPGPRAHNRLRGAEARRGIPGH